MVLHFVTTGETFPLLSIIVDDFGNETQLHDVASGWNFRWISLCHAVGDFIESGEVH
ncbi:hypothetical protein IST4116A_01232 [Burkholderia cenocepacia]|uniref:hypothetical protein n=1 Tax=Burkholderia cenocepacia TaxID=95486 RepID=UPI0019B6E3D5|nr:hypothetical protein [Burkholderia cenocepacia]CAB5083313.1 hypothetical protein IST4116B_01224 [Burkholderia cenocepacia]CAB5084002.1 hypothetical protein IST4134_01233 [Burkholderia cenocepacia]CAB5088045.1 hypothetical protein IST4113_01231 [Burkholderia cenocepacia]CAB5096099.1 hypothetical protein IST439_01271 [Burkholderia cenocepacia]CAB5105550.1 hypothetical protein IST4129_01232 [Burkholderia cenocepacia]